MSIISKRGDTILEVTIAITVFCLVSIITMGIMDRDLNSIQGALELEMSRNEIDSQAEALRFIHDSYLAEHEYNSEEYKALWKQISQSTSNGGLVNNPANISPFSATQCSTYYDDSQTSKGEPHNIFTDNAFVFNTRDLDPTNLGDAIITTKDSKSKFIPTSLYPRIVYTAPNFNGDTDTSLTEAEALSGKIYNQIKTIEGVWVIAARDATENEDASLDNSTPEFFDYHIRTCWYPPSRSYPSTIATIVRLYNPDFDYIEKDEEPSTLAVSPSPVFTPGGESITLTTNLAPDVDMIVSSVQINDNGTNKNCNSFRITTNNNRKAITCTTPAASSGSHTVTVTASIRGEATTKLTGSIRYETPSITTVSPSSLYTGETNRRITISTNVPKDTKINISSIKIFNNSISRDCTSPQITNSGNYRAVTCTAPNLSAGTYNVSTTLSIRDGNSSTPSKLNSLTYLPSGITSVSPNRILINNTAAITIVTQVAKGTTMGVSEVKVGNSPCTNPRIVDSGNYRAIACTAPGLGAGTYSISATISINNGNSFPASLANALTYYGQTIANITYMQQMTPEICKNTPVGTTKTLTDNRDSQQYKVFKAKDGNCWMGENLRYGSTTSNAARVYNSADAAKSDNINASKMSELKSSHICTTSLSCQATDGKPMFSGWPGGTSVSSYTEPYIMIYRANTAAGYDGKTKFGVIYNYCAATGGTTCNRDHTWPDPATGSVCPKGWKMPGITNDATGSGADTSGNTKTYDNLANAYGYRNNRAGLNGMLSSPLNFVRAGYAYEGSLASRSADGIGRYWSSVVFSTRSPNAYVLYLRNYSNANNNAYVVEGNVYRYFGASIRCVSS